MVFLLIRAQLSSTKRKEALRALTPLLEPTRILSGCINCNAYQDINNKNVLALHELWDSGESLKKRLRSEEFKVVWSIVDLALKEPEIHVATVSARGFGIEALRIKSGIQ